MNYKEQAIENIRNKTALVVCGGGVLGIAECAALIELEAQGLLFSNLTSVCGSSIGSIISTTIVAGGTSEYLKKTVNDIDPNMFQEHNYLVQGVQLVCKYGLNKTTPIMNLITKILTDHGHEADITFKQLFDKTNVHLTLTYLSLNYERTMYADHITEPDSLIRDVVVKSSAIPVFYQAVIEGKRKTGFISCDGGTDNNYPMNIPRQQGVDPRKIIGLKLLSPKNFNHVENGGPEELINHGPPKNIIDYAMKIIEILRRQAMRTHVSENDWQLTVRINVGALTSTSFNLTKDQKEWLYNQGKLAVLSYVDKLAALLEANTYAP